MKKKIERLIKKDKVTPSWCGECLGDLDLRYTPVEETKLTIVYGTCEKCHLVICLKLLKDKEVFAIDYIPKEERNHYDTKSTDKMFGERK